MREQDGPRRLSPRSSGCCARKPRKYEDYRGYATRIARGSLAVGDTVRGVRSGQGARITHLDGVGGPRERRHGGESVAVQLSADVDLARGDVLVKDGEPAPQKARAAEATLLWLGEESLAPGTAVKLKHGTTTIGARLRSAVTPLERNESTRAQLDFDEPLVFDRFSEDRGFGGFVLTDARTGATLAAGLLRDPL